MTTISLQLKLRRGRYVVGLVAAFVFSFALAIFVGLLIRENAGERTSVVLPVERTSNTAGRAVGILPNQVRADLHDGSETSTAQHQVLATRMDSRVVHNPFGTLNLLASAEPDTVPALLNDFRAPTSRRKRRAKRAVPAPMPPPVQVAAPNPTPPTPAPTAPPMPFTAAGAIQGARIAQGRQVVFLRQGDEVLAVRSGDTVGQNYRVEDITPEKIEFTYLPLKQRQTLSLTP